MPMLRTQYCHTLAASVLAILLAPGTDAVQADVRGRVAPTGSKANDPCLEMEANREVMVETAKKKEAVASMFVRVLDTCSLGLHHLECVARAEYATVPSRYLALCNKKMGPRPTHSGPVCTYAKEKLPQYGPDARNYRALAKVLDGASHDCSGLPWECFALATSCLQSPNIPFCFNQCVRNGNMQHALTTPKPQKMIGG